MSKHKIFTRPWGHYALLGEGDGWLVKKLMVNPGARLSLQSHKLRSERWTVIDGVASVQIDNLNLLMQRGDQCVIPTGATHRLYNISTRPLGIIEIWMGILDEEDIVRYEDDYGRVRKGK